MKQHTGDEIRTIMTQMPIELVEALQAAHVEHKIPSARRAGGAI